MRPTLILSLPATYGIACTILITLWNLTTVIAANRIRVRRARAASAKVTRARRVRVAKSLPVKAVEKEDLVMMMIPEAKEKDPVETALEIAGKDLAKRLLKIPKEAAVELHLEPEQATCKNKR
jgi:hypothetical protein